MASSDPSSTLRDLLPNRSSVARSFGTKRFDQGAALFESGAVSNLRLRESEISGNVREYQRRHTPLWRITPNRRLHLECTCPQFAYCPHQVAIFLAALERLASSDYLLDQIVPKQPGNGTVQNPEPQVDPTSATARSADCFLTPVIDMAGFPKVTFLLDRGGNKGLERKSISWILQFTEKRTSSQPAPAWPAEDAAILRYFQNKHRYWKEATLAWADFMTFLEVVRGHPRLLLSSGRKIQVSRAPLEIPMAGRVTPQGVALTLILRCGEKVIEGRRLEPVGFESDTLWFFDGETFCSRHPRFPASSILAAARGPSFHLTDQRRLLETLKTGMVTFDGRVPTVRVEQANARFFLGAEDDGHLWLQAEVQSRESDTVCDLDNGFTYSRDDNTFTFFDPALTSAARKSIGRAGFQAATSRRSERGSLFYTPLDSWPAIASNHLPEWRKKFRVDLDNGLEDLLDERNAVTPRITADWDGEIDWFEVRWQLQAGNQVLTAADIKALRQYRRPIYRTESGRLVRVDLGQLRRQLKEFKALGVPRDVTRRVPLHLLTRVADCGGLSEAPQNLRRLRDQLEGFAGIETVEPPAPLGDVLRHYQQDGLDYLNFLARYRFGGILADDMGLGKTLQALAILELYRVRQGRAPSLVVCPTSVAANWVEEARRFVPEMKAVHLRSSQEIRQCRADDYDLMIVSYALARRNTWKRAFRFLVLDEAQNIKNPKARVAAAVKQIPASHRLALTGTPVENSLVELWSIFDFLMPGFLGNLSHFKAGYAAPVMKDRDHGALAPLVRRVKPFILRRLKSQVARELPERIEQNIYCELTPLQKRMYRDLVAAVRSDIDREIGAKGWDKSQICILAALLRLRQLCCHPLLVDKEASTIASGKMEGFLETLGTILAGSHRVIVFSQFVQMLKIIEAQLRQREIPYLYLDGHTRDRARRLKEFQEGKHSVFLMSLKAGGTGVNLTAADYVILYDPWWNPAVENQAIDRTHRIGQTRTVTAYRMITKDTLEEKMLQLKARKQDLADRILASDSGFLRRMTREDLEELLVAD